MIRVLKVFPGDEKFLRTKSAEVVLTPLVTEDDSEQFVLSAEVTDLATDLVETMRYYGAAGISAVQVGELLRVIAFLREDGEAQILINPEITTRDGEFVQSTEGCLSFPSVFEMITKTRNEGCVVTGVDETGNRVTLALEGVQAVAVQHEVDHCDGILFTDHMSPLKRRYAVKRITKVNKRIEHAKERMEKSIKAAAKGSRISAA